MIMTDNIYYSIAKKLKLSSDDILFIASDVKKMALDSRANNQMFDANTFINSFQEELPKGTLIIPAYTDYLKNGDVFDYDKSKPSTGALSNKTMKRKDFGRSFDPLHSVFSWGAKSSEIQKLNGKSTLGEGSVFDFLYREKAKMICIDVDFQDSLTFVHYVEERLKVKYRKAYEWEMIIREKGKEKKKPIVFFTRRPWVLTNLHAMQQRMIKHGVVKKIVVGKSNVLFFDIGEIYDFIRQDIQSGKKLYDISIIHWGKNILRKLIKKK